uniref:Peptide transporter n=1 Tax=Rhabditophanes sp. KR3021 TaxID=114890 RepID=A0AC35U792_9BILA
MGEAKHRKSSDSDCDSESVMTNFETKPLTPIYTEWGDIIKNWPLTTFCIVSNEFCERFSYYGMRTVLTLYLLNVLKMSYNSSTVFFNGFTVLCYLTPLLGSVLADGYIGKFKTIFFVSILYTIGQIILAFSSISNFKSSLHPWLDYLGLAIIGFGTGGIKPCVNSFGGEQFEQHQERMLSLFFSMFYFSINAGSMISTFISPIFRSMPCLGQDTCFPLAFGIPACLMIVATVVFMAGSFKYKKPVVKENVFGVVFHIMGRALKNKWNRKSKEKRDHWLDHYMSTHVCASDEKCVALQKLKRDGAACDKYNMVDDIKQLLRVMIMFLPVPIFWSLYDQQGSIWLIQAIQMDCRVGSLLILPDQMQTLNAVLILIFIPLFQIVIYPVIEIFFKLTSLRKMVLGGLLATAAFVVSGLVQFQINKTLPVNPIEGQSFVNFFNTLSNCEIYINPTNLDSIVTNNIKNATIGTSPISALTTVETGLVVKSGASTFNIRHEGRGCGYQIPQSVTYKFDSQQVAYIVFNKQGVYKQVADQTKPTEGTGEFSMNINMALDIPYAGNLALCKLDADNFDKKFPCDPRQSGSSFYYWERNYDDGTDDMNSTIYQNNFGTATNVSNYSFKPVKPGKWGLYYMFNTPKDINHQTYSKENVEIKRTGVEFDIKGQGGIFSFIVTGNYQHPQFSYYQFVSDNTVSIVWQVPQIVIITAAEICFSVTGLEFAYSQAAPSMKAVVQALWLLTTAIGDSIIVLIAALNLFDDMAVEFMVYAGAMLVVIVIFALLSQFYYEYKNYGEETEDKPKLTTFNNTGYVEHDEE